MSKQNDYMNGRMEGMAYALRIAEKDGIEGLREELLKRNITKINLNVSHKELEKATEQMRNMMFDTFMAFTVGILHDVWGFGPDRTQKFMDKFQEGAELMEQGVITWDEIIENAYEVVGKKLAIRHNDTNTRLEKIY